MLTTPETHFQNELLERRNHLVQARPMGPWQEIEDLIADVDAALERLQHGRFGICDVCHDHVDADRLARDPLARCCWEHTTAAEQRRIDRDLSLARSVQLGLLPPPGLAVDGWQFRYRYEAANEVGGDFCDVISIPSRAETLILVGDVSGKGVAASLLMSHLVGTFRSLSSIGLPTGELLARVNTLFHDSKSSTSYATLAAASLFPDGRVDLYSAGHWPPILRRKRTSEPVPVTPGLPLGLFGGSQYAPTHVDLAPDDTLLFFTDGVIDAENEDGEDYSVRRLTRTLAAAPGTRPDTVVEHCLGDVRKFQDREPLTDDLILFALARS